MIFSGNWTEIQSNVYQCTRIPMESLIFCRSVEMLELCDLQFLFSRQFINNSYIFLPVFKFHDRKQKCFLDIIGVFKRTMVIQSMPMPQPSVGGNPYSREVQKFSSINMSFKKLLLPHGAIAYFLLHDKKLKCSVRLFRAVPFWRRAYYLWVSTDECKTCACHFQELPTSLSKSLAVVQGREHSIAFVTCILSILWVFFFLFQRG